SSAISIAWSASCAARRRKSASRSRAAARSITASGTCMAREPSSRSDAQEHHLDRIEDDRQVEEQRLALDVVEVVLELLQHVLRRRAVLAAHLRVTGDAGLHVEALLEERHLLIELLDEDGPLGARADHAHVAAEDVPELRELVETRLPDEAADLRHA